MEMPRPTEADKEFFRSIVPEHPDVEVRPMFGQLGAFVSGNMFAGLFGSDVGVKLDTGGLDELGQVEGSRPYGPAERPMGGFLSLPSAWRDSPDLAEPWLERARTYVATFPPKVKKPKKK
jgi:TfoX/Sxy family transcriptional regulator of competence genes